MLKHIESEEQVPSLVVTAFRYGNDEAGVNALPHVVVPREHQQHGRNGHGETKPQIYRQIKRIGCAFVIADVTVMLWQVTLVIAALKQISR